MLKSTKTVPISQVQTAADSALHTLANNVLASTSVGAGTFAVMPRQEWRVGFLALSLNIRRFNL